MVFTIDIQGYFRDESRKSFPNYSGIYFVYRGVLIPHLKSVTLTQLLYIGETQDIGSRLLYHEKREDFLSKLKEGEDLFYSFANTKNMSERDRKRIEAALIYELRPPINSLSTELFEYNSTTVHISGNRHAYIPSLVEAPTY